MISAVNYNKVLEILRSDSQSLSELAAISGRDKFTFYRGADLTNLDLRGQNLTGLNFDNADIRFSRIDDTNFDKGAFNRTLVDASQAWATDEYESYFNELLDHPIRSVLIFCKIRPGMIDGLLYELGISFREFSNKIKVSENAIRKSRNGEVIAYETAVSVLKGYDDIVENLKEPLSNFAVALRQPCLAFLFGGNNKPFRRISTERLQELTRFKAFVDKLSPKNDDFVFRETPDYLEVLYERYHEVPRLPYWVGYFGDAEFQ